MSCPIQIISWECVSYFAFIVLVLVGWCKGRLVCTNWVLVRSWWWLDWRFARLEVFVVVDISVISCCRMIAARHAACDSLPRLSWTLKPALLLLRYCWIVLLCPHPHSGGIKRWCASVVCLSDACIGPKSRTQRLRKTKIGKEVAHVTRDSGTAFKVERSKVNLQGRGHIVAASRTACYICLWPRVSFRILLYWHIFDSYFLLRLFFVNIT